MHTLHDPQLHQVYVGAENRRILENLDFLYQNGATITLRCPVIPGVNDTVDHFTAIARLEQQYPGLSGIEIMPYHDFGKSKFAALGRPYRIDEKTVSQETKASWREIMKQCGCSDAVVASF